ncbi:MAG: glucoamylase family protein [Chryseotalea sp.]
MKKALYFTLFINILLIGCSDSDTSSENQNFTLLKTYINGSEVTGSVFRNIPVNSVIEFEFSEPVDIISAQKHITLFKGSDQINLTFTTGASSNILQIEPQTSLAFFTRHDLAIAAELTSIKGKKLNLFMPYRLFTELDLSDKFPSISEEELLTKVQQQTFKYFYDFAQANSGMARERNTSGDLVTSGGSGFGLMALIVGIERGFITREQGLTRFEKIISFLETADRFHGAWAHWMNGNTGDVIPFSTKDNGGDLVETSFLVQGLITVRQYLNPNVAREQNLINRINELWEDVEWSWYRKNNENVLYWHWSPNFGWEMNFPMYGYFEQQITYILAAASPTYSIPKIVYANGYGRNGAIVKNNFHYGIQLPLESPAPLFWVHYSYLGMHPNIKDDYANYWTQNKNATLINRAYCIANPRGFIGHSATCWGLTSSDTPGGYFAHAPGNDNGTISPTAALSSFPYTPEQSMEALKFFYYTLGDRLWGPYGFYDAFNPTQDWYASSYLAIDQGPIIVMIENHRTGLLWNLFMSAPEIQTAFTKLNITYPAP